MSKYAVIQFQGKQWQVTEGEKLIVDRVEQPEGAKFDVTDVLLVVDGSTREIGTPVVAGAKVECEVVSHEKDDKIRVAKYKAKSRYRKVYGHRQQISTISIVAIKS